MMKGLDDESAKGAAYRYFDLCDREFIECRVRLSEILRSVEQREHEAFKSNRQETESSRSGRSRVSEELNQAYQSYDELLDDESAKGATYRYFDLCDWEFIECLVRLSEILCSVEQREHEEFESSRQETESSHSARSRVSGSLRSSRLLVMSKRAEAAT
ncbi:hypothetical protein pdam_00014875 [Pocillopora damicornis]|uniref:Uncharacterized protein n=1 Tax=Pocillopora damicornis TaxID=46731 RepID=A0A3M6THS8_POCDA|nr:hypothetical protein pdam_00014875 [Pocillopora damicornis]